MFNSNIQHNIIKRTYTVLALMFCCLSASFAHIDLDTEIEPGAYSNRVSKSDAALRLNQLNSIIDIKITDEVQERIQQYTYHYRDSAEKILGRVNTFFPIFEREIMRRGMPDDLKYLAVVESLLKPEATSKSGAAGLWQFMKGTGKMVGLEVNSIVDQRRSIELSTQAALDYLQSLYDRFDDWNLAIAAYNCGPGNVAKAIKRSGSKDYWKMRNFLPKETRKYLPRFIAAMYLTNFYQYHGLNPSVNDMQFNNVVTVSVRQEIQFAKLTKDLGLEEVSEIKNLNPEYLRNYIPTGKGQYTLTFPSHCLDKYFEHYEPGIYTQILEDRAEKIRQDELAKQEAEAALLESMRRETVSTLESIVTLILQSIQSSAPKSKKYAIPSRMRASSRYSE